MRREHALHFTLPFSRLFIHVYQAVLYTKPLRKPHWNFDGTLISHIFLKIVTLRKKYPNTEFYWPVFSPNAEHRPEKTPYLDTFHAL